MIRLTIDENMDESIPVFYCDICNRRIYDESKGWMIWEQYNGLCLHLHNDCDTVIRNKMKKCGFKKNSFKVKTVYGMLDNSFFGKYSGNLKNKMQKMMNENINNNRK